MVRRFSMAKALFKGAALFIIPTASVAADGVVKAPAPASIERVAGHRETAVFAGGCFWGV